MPRAFATALAAALLLALPASNAVAAPGDASDPRPAEYVTIDRPVREVAIDPGASVVETVTIKNQTPRAVDVTVAGNDLAVRTDGSRSPKFAAAGSQPRGAGAWLVAAPDELRIPAGSERRVQLRITAPAGTRAGGWQAAAILSVTGVGDAGNVGITQEVPVLLLVGVRGDAKRGLRATIEAESRVRARGGRTTWAVHVENAGDVHESYGGRVVVRGRTGGSRTVQLEPGILLPGESRNETVGVELREAPDVVDARLEVRTRGRAGTDDAPTDGTVTDRSATTWVLPWWLPLVLVIAVVVIVVRVRRRRTWVDDDVDRDVE